MIYSLDDYFLLHGREHEDYIRSVSKDCLKSGMLKWNPEEESIWAGSYTGGYCAFTMEVVSSNLKTIEGLDEDQMNYYKFSTFNFPSGLLAKYFDNSLLCNDLCTFIYKYNDSDMLYSRSTLTEDEYYYLISKLTDVEHYAYFNKFEKQCKSPKWSSNMCTVENPVCLYLYGTDDTSYSFFVNSVEKANYILDELSNNQTLDNLKALGGVFTN